MSWAVQIRNETQLVLVNATFNCPNYCLSHPIPTIQ